MKVLLATMILAQAMTAVVAAAPSGFAYCPHNEHYYKAVHAPEGLSWSAAKSEAEKAGGYLATITSKEENKFIYWLVNREELWISTGPFDNFGPWIGGYQERGAREPDRDWKWVTGEEFFFVNWAQMEPSGRWKGKDENCLQLYSKNGNKRAGTWNDSLDTPDSLTIRGYVIEKGAIEADRRNTLITEPLDEVHEFHSVSGKTCRGKVLAYNPNNDTVTIVKENKHSHKVSLSCFSEADRTYVREWHLVKEFCNNNRLRETNAGRRRARERDP
jgi:hypothetical protein